MGRHDRCAVCELGGLAALRSQAAFIDQSKLEPSCARMSGDLPWTNAKDASMLNVVRMHLWVECTSHKQEAHLLPGDVSCYDLRSTLVQAGQVLCDGRVLSLFSRIGSSM